jgi:hypothetical protein
MDSEQRRLRPKLEARTNSLLSWIKRCIFRKTLKYTESVTPSTFHSFKRLPAELRREIWWLAATNSPRRTIKLESDSDFEYNIAERCFQKNLWALARSCSEARQELTFFSQKGIGADDNDSPKFQRYGLYYRLYQRPAIFRYDYDTLDIGSISPDERWWGESGRNSQPPDNPE